MAENPIDPRPDAAPLRQVVVDLGDMRVQFGLPRTPRPKCSHKRLTYSPEERRVWCLDCESTVDGYDAFMVLVTHFQNMEREARRRLKRATEAQQAHIHRTAAKALDRAWSGRSPMAVACPHCGDGLLPEDFQNGGLQTSRQIEIARRERKRKLKEGKPNDPRDL